MEVGGRVANSGEDVHYSAHRWIEIQAGFGVVMAARKGLGLFCEYSSKAGQRIALLE